MGKDGEGKTEFGKPNLTGTQTPLDVNCDAAVAQGEVHVPGRGWKGRGREPDVATANRCWGPCTEWVSHHHHVSSSSSISERDCRPPCFSKFTIAEKGIVSEATCNLTECFSLSPGTYVVVVSAGREAVEFLLRIFLKMPDSDRNLDDNLNLRPLQVSARQGLVGKLHWVTSGWKVFGPSPYQTGSLLPQKFDVGYSSLDPGKSSRNGSQRSIIYKYAQQSGRCAPLLLGTDVIPASLPRLDQGLDIDDTQVQRLLNQEFLKGPPGDTFSLDEFRSIVALTDLKVNGRLDQEEFSRLWSCLVHCQSVFQNSRKNSGVFPSPDLWKAIKDTDFLAGISVTNERLDVMRLRYSDSTGKVSFPSLVCVLMQLEAVTRAFQNLSEDGKGLYLTEMEVRYLPLPETGHNPRLPLLA
ncbi:hypothetical protein J1605_012089 [Eschrichtius robustus]|uniref:Calpain-3/13-like C-terminal EF-hand domain-containing protein n=1 Tax=Eschrichtius robustus TaxID=9764 RepID=A0AB34GML0_ESCRO|nr:hypothetical protein J1605_012089 [Eschrichtius robustus]